MEDSKYSQPFDRKSFLIQCLLVLDLEKTVSQHFPSRSLAGSIFIKHDYKCIILKRHSSTLWLDLTVVTYKAYSMALSLSLAPMKSACVQRLWCKLRTPVFKIIKSQNANRAALQNCRRTRSTFEMLTLHTKDDQQT